MRRGNDRRHGAGRHTTLFLAIFGVVQLVLAGRVLVRMISSFGGSPLREASGSLGARVTVIVPVLNEEARLEPCLDGLRQQGPEVAEILVVDGGSTDGTRGIVARAAKQDARIRWLDASPVPREVNGKAWNLQTGLAAARGDSGWVMTMDADVRPETGLVAALVARAESDGLEVLSGATRQRLSGLAEAFLHPAMLTSLVYRYGIPGGSTSNPDAVQANGQCMLIRHQRLREINGFADGLGSLCEDVTVARRLARAGYSVGFAETGPLATAGMYDSASDAWRNWPRSLTMIDQYAGLSVPMRLAEVIFVQALPPIVTVAGTVAEARQMHSGRGGNTATPASGRLSDALAWVLTLNRVLSIVRLGVMVGSARAYARRPLTYWLSPLADGPVAVRLVVSAMRRTHTWRGRSVRRGGPPA